MAGKQSRYRGAQPFETSDRHLFFGRDRDIEDLHDFILLEKLVVLFGKSGLGKSSLLNAGIVPRLQDNSQTEGFGFQPIEVRFTHYEEGKSSSPIETLKRLLSEFPVNSDLKFPDRLIGEESLWTLFKSRQTPNGGRFVLLFDQFEEFFSYPAEQQKHFMRQLAELMYSGIPQSVRRQMEGLTADQRRRLSQPMNIKAVMAIRSDRMSHLDSMKQAFPSILHKRFELRPLTPDQAREAIVMPARMIGEEFASPPFEFTEDGLNAMVDALSRQAGKQQTNSVSGIEAFLLQILCEYLEGLVKNGKVMQRSDNGLPTVTEQDLPEMDHLYDAYYERKLHELPASSQSTARLILEEGLLAVDNSTGEGRRKSVDLHDLLQLGATEQLISRLESTYLIRRQENTVGSYSFEISHDSLVGPIQKALKAREAEEEKERLRQEQIKKEQQLAEARKQAALETRRRYVATLLSIASVLGLLVALWFYFDSKKAKELAIEAKTRAEIEKTNAKKQEEYANKKKEEAEDAKEELQKQIKIVEQKTREAEASLKKMQAAQAAKTEVEIARYLRSAERMIDLKKYDIARQILNEALKLDKNHPGLRKKLNEIDNQ